MRRAVNIGAVHDGCSIRRKRRRHLKSWRGPKQPGSDRRPLFFNSLLRSRRLDEARDETGHREDQDNHDGQDQETLPASRARWRHSSGRGCNGRLAPQCADEAISARRDRLDVPRRLGIVAEGLSQLRDGAGQRVLGHGHTRPDLAKKLLLCHERFRALQKENQDLQRLRLDMDRLPGLEETKSGRVDDEIVELIAHRWQLTTKITLRGSVGFTPVN